MSNQTDKATIELVVNGRQSETSLKSIATAATNARKELYKMAETDPGYAKQKKELEALMAVQQQRIVRIHEEKTAWEKFKAGSGNILAGVVGGNIATQGIQALAALLPAVIDRSMKLKDSFADIAKATDMTDAEVQDLNNDLKKLNTRTATEDLRSMAVVAGQFGIAKDQVEGFVESADKLNVALGDQFDSAEQVAEVNLKLRNIFQDIKSDNIGEDMLHIGNGLNYLEAQGAATAPVMADFSSRIGGIAIPLGLTSGQVLGLSATLQELSITSERGSSAVTDILNGMAKAPESFSKYAVGVDGAKLSTKQFKDLLNTDMNAALLAVIRGFKEGDTSATGMAAKMADMDMKGNGVMEVFMKLASNTDLLTQRQGEAATALTNTTSITNEFSKKNHELSVNLKKLGEWFNSFLENGTLMKFAGGIVNLTVKLLGLNDASNKVTQNYGEQRSKVEGLTKQMGPLLERYEELTKKAKRSAAEQAELSKLTGQIAGIMPGAVTQFDRYGNAIGVSTVKARELIEAQKEMQRQMKAGAVAEQQQQLRNLAYQRQQTLKKLQSREDVSVSASGNVTVTPLSPADIKKLQDDLAKNQQQVNETVRQLRDAEGLTSIADRRKARRGPVEAPKPKAADGTQESETERKAREKKEKADERQASRDQKAGERKQSQALKAAERHEDELERLMGDARERTAKADGDAFRAEQLQLGDRYAKMFELAGGNKEKMAEINRLMYQELAAIEKKESERQFKEGQKRQKQLIAEAEEELKLKKKTALAEIEMRVAAGGLTKEQGKMAGLDVEAQFLDAKELLYTAHYDTLRTMAGENADLLAEISTSSKEKQAEIDAEQTTNAGEQATARTEIHTAEVKHDEDLAEKRKQFSREEKDFRQQILGELSSMLMQDWTSTIQGYKDYWKQATLVQKAALIASKAWALAEIGINLARQISLVNTAATVMDAVVPFSGEPYRIKGIAVAIGTAALQTAKVVAAGVQTPAFEDGGFTSSDKQPSGYTNGPTYYAKKNFIAGEAGPEWIMSAPMLANPVFANLAGALQAIQQTGSYRSMSAGSPAAAPSGQGATQAGGMSNEIALAILDQLRRNNTKMEDIANRPINYNHFKIADTEAYLAHIDEETTL